MKKYIRQVISLIGSDRDKLPGLVVIFLAGSLLDLLGIGLIGPYFAIIFDESSQSIGIGEIFTITTGIEHDRDRLIVISGVVIFLVFLLKSMFAVYINYEIINFSKMQQVRLRSTLMHAYQSMPFEEYVNRNSSEYIHSIQSLVVQYTDNVLIPILRSVSDLIVAMVIIGFLAFSNVYVLILLVSLLALMVVGYDKLFRKKIRIYGKKANIAGALMVQGVHEGIEGLLEIRVLGNQSYFYHKVHNQAVKFAGYQAKTRLLGTSSRYLLELVLISFVVLLVLLMVISGENLQTLIPVLAVFGVASIRLLPTATAFSSNLVQIRFGRDAVSLLSKDLEQINSNSIERAEGNKSLPIQDFRSINIDDITYRYNGAESNALENITMSIKKGESVGIIGASGSGKTTLINLLLGLLDPISGDMSFNGLKLTENKELWQRQVAYMPQQVLLIDGSLRNNIALGVEDSKIDDEKIFSSIDKASLTSVVERIPEGVDAQLGERGVRLSGGQRQRIALARAFYHDRNVLVMDESTSALDHETEQEIIHEIKKLHGKKTMIVIAHRHTTVAHCDRIYRMDKGRIVEVGKPETILKQ